MKTAKVHKTPAIFTTYDIGRMTGTDPTTVHKWIDKGLMRGYRTPGGHRRVRADDLRTFLLAHKMPVPKEIGGADNLRVLLVDDDAQVLKSVPKALKRLRPNWEFVALESGIEALLRMQTLAPDVVVLDIFMPELDGFEVCRRMRARQETAGIKVVAVSGRHTADVEKKALAAGAFAFLKKPLAGPELLAAIEVAVGLRPAAMAG